MMMHNFSDAKLGEKITFYSGKVSVSEFKIPQFSLQFL
jgi:hypothetical protein